MRFRSDPEPPESPWPPADVESLPDKERDAAERDDDTFALESLLMFPRQTVKAFTTEPSDEQRD